MMDYPGVTIKNGNCERCAGCGYLDDGEHQPFKYWLELPAQSAVALQTGLVKPYDCPDCRAAGSAAPC